MSTQLRGLVPRRLAPIVASRMAEEPVVLLQGPRSVGKSTLLRSLAADIGAELVDLDDLATRDAAARDPGMFVTGADPVCIDEYQHIPIILDAIKAELNRDGRPGRFVLTGSARHEALPRAAQALTGRLHRLPVYPLSQGELRGVQEHLLDDLFADPAAAVAAARPSDTTREDYIDSVTAGGFPSVLARASLASRNRWFDDYVSLSLERDVRDLSRIRQAASLPALLERLAGQTAQILNITRAASSVRLDEKTAHSYVRLLEAVFLLYRLPAWGTTLTTRSTASPKIHVLDSGVAARLMRLTPQKLAARSPTALTEFGHLLETFVVTELLKQASWADWVGGVGHWRTRDGDEVDLVVERDDGTVVAFEIKAAGRVPGEDLAPLRKLRDATGDAFVAGVVFYLGTRSYTFEDRLHVMPVDRIWAP
ncbi:ATP-binding protein [Frankia gtarii]|uniref:ATP-binding protein n=1 Tax=Frankia gtarii TaxID=2950102 RepID=UPI0021BE69AD|nr:ATP-binding protein [Frankia gtarii]